MIESWMEEQVFVGSPVLLTVGYCAFLGEDEEELLHPPASALYLKLFISLLCRRKKTRGTPTCSHNSQVPQVFSVPPMSHSKHSTSAHPANEEINGDFHVMSNFPSSKSFSNIIVFKYWRSQKVMIILIFKNVQYFVFGAQPKTFVLKKVKCPQAKREHRAYRSSNMDALISKFHPCCLHLSMKSKWRSWLLFAGCGRSLAQRVT